MVEHLLADNLMGGNLFQLLYFRILNQIPASRYLHSQYRIRTLSLWLPPLDTVSFTFRSLHNPESGLFPRFSPAPPASSLPRTPLIALRVPDSPLKAIRVLKFRDPLRGAPLPL